MSRHRDFHGINQRYHEYDDGYDDYEECTGTSLTDSCVSPGTAAQFTFNRDRRNNQFADFLRREEENEIAEEPSDILDNYVDDQFSPQNDFNSSFEKPKLTDDEHAKLLSCMDAIRDVMGEEIPDGVVTKVIIDSQYDSEKALNTLLEYGCKDSSGKSGGAGAEMSRRLQADSQASCNILISTNRLPLLSLASPSGLVATPQHGNSITLNTDVPAVGQLRPSSKLSLSNLNKNALGGSLSGGTSLSTLAATHLRTDKASQGVPIQKIAQPTAGECKSTLGKPQITLLKPTKTFEKCEYSLPKPQLTLGQFPTGLSQLSATDSTNTIGKVSSASSLHVLQDTINLSCALKTKPVQSRPEMVRAEEPMVWTSDANTALEQKPYEPSLIQTIEGQVDEKLLAREVSAFGRLMCGGATKPLIMGDIDWSYQSQLQLVHPLLCKFQDERKLADIQSFDFTSPSPDDIVSERQRGAFTRTGERVVMKPPAVETSRADKGSQKQSKAVPKLAAFQIGDSYDETETRLLESTSQLSLKSQNGASSKKEPKTPINAQLKGVKALIEAEGTRSPSLSRSSSKSKLERLDASAEYEKRSEQGKELINLVVIGHVDAGKSTLMGHVLYQLGVVSQRQMHRFEMDSKKLGKASFMYAWVLDETEEERNRGVTMDVAQTRFETSTRIINLLDAPGHKDFIPNMITGAAQADCALLVVNATNGEFETGFELGGQTREHTILIRSLGVSQLVVAINKMDTVNWSQTRFLEIASKLSVFLKQTGFKDADIQYIPCSGLNGVNIVKPATNLPAFSWYTGKPLIQEIENFKPPERLVNKPLRMCVQDIFKGMSGSFSVAGRMEAGDIQNGDRVLVMPSAEYATVKGILIDEGPEKIGFAGDTVTLQLLGIDIQKVHVGCVLCDPASPVPVVTRLKARLIIFNLEVPITQGYPVVYHSQSLNEPANISKLISKLHKSTAEVLKRKPRCLTKNSTAVVEITLARPQCVELYRDFKDLGRFMLRSEGHTIAAGIVMEICPNKN